MEPEKTPTMLASATPVEATATVGVEGVDAAVAQVKSLAPDGAGAGLLVGGAAMLAVIGAAIKFGPQVLKDRAEKQAQAHELEMERLKLEREKSERQDDQHKACAVERAALEAKVSLLVSRVEEIESKTGSSSLSLGDFDPELIEKRLASVEKKLKPIRGGKKG